MKKLHNGGTYFAFALEGMLAAVERLELVAGLEVGPPIQLAVNHVREPLLVRHLDSPVRRPRDRHTLGIGALHSQGPHQILFRTLFLRLPQFLQENRLSPDGPILWTTILYSFFFFEFWIENLPLHSGILTAGKATMRPDHIRLKSIIY